LQNGSLVGRSGYNAGQPEPIGGPAERSLPQINSMKNLREIEVNLSTKNQNGALGGLKVGMVAGPPNSGGYQQNGNYGQKNNSGNKYNKYVIGVNSS